MMIDFTKTIIQIIIIIITYILGFFYTINAGESFYYYIWGILSIIIATLLLILFVNKRHNYSQNLLTNVIILVNVLLQPFTFIIALYYIRFQNIAIIIFDSYFYAWMMLTVHCFLASICIWYIIAQWLAITTSNMIVVSKNKKIMKKNEL
jgi:hypothetical protein